MSRDSGRRPRRAAAETGDGGGFLTRWSRLKRSPEAVQEESASAASREAPPAPEKSGKKSDEEVLAELDLPAPELLGRDEIRDFLAAPITESLRRRALRRLWQLDPVLANLDGLVDYGEDFTGEGVVTGIIETAFRIGRGMVEAAEGDAVAGAAAEGEGVVAGSPAKPDRVPDGDAPAASAPAGPVRAEMPAGEGAAPDGDDSSAAAEKEAGTGAEGTDPSAGEPPLPRPRRMRFRPV